LRMGLSRAKANVARTAHLTAWARALGRLTAGEVANGDYLADRALRPHQAALIRVPGLCRWLFERGLPGALGYFNARTRYFDDVLLEEARVGLEQLVILGAGFDSRSIRFSDARLRKYSSSSGSLIGSPMPMASLSFNCSGI